MHTLKNGESKFQVEATLKVDKEGIDTQLHLLISTSQIFHSNRKFVLLCLQDITDRKKLEEQLLQSQKMEAIGLLAGGIAHDFNNNLLAITGMCSLLKKRITKSDTEFSYVDLIESASHKSTQLIKQLLAFSRKDLIEPTIININDLLIDLKKMLIQLISEDIEIVYSLGENIKPINSDKNNIELIVINLMVNARDSMQSGGKIFIKTADVKISDDDAEENVSLKPGNFVVLSIKDTGHGMDDETIKHIFEPFFTTKDVGKGSGLGLSTVYGIVEKWGGFITVNSKPGYGTEIIAYLPTAEGIIAQNERKKDVEMNLLQGTETILLIDDDDIVRLTISQFLKEFNYNVIIASSSVQSWEIFKAKKDIIDLVISDVVMPEISGKELLKRFSSIKPDVRFLFISGYTEDVISHHGVLDKEINFLQKPFELEELIKNIREIIDKNSS